MTKKNLEDIENKKKKLKKVEDSSEKTIDALKEHAEKTGSAIKSVEEIKESSQYLQDVLDGLDPVEVTKMSDGQYNGMTANFETVMASGNSVFALHGEISKKSEELDKTFAVVGSTSSVVFSNTAEVHDYVANNPNYFKNAKTLKENYQQVYDHKGDEKFIEEWIKKNRSDLIKEFVENQSNFYSHSGETKYQALIASRSLFYHKVLFKKGKDSAICSNEEHDKNKKYLRYILTGNKNEDPLYETLVVNAHRVYGELSDEGIKYGSGNEAVYENIYKQMISAIASILKNI